MSDDNTIYPNDDNDDENNARQNRENKPKELKIPVLENSDLGVRAWLEKDKNSNVYVSVSIPALGTSWALFAADEAMTNALNHLWTHLIDERGDR